MSSISINDIISFLEALDLNKYVHAANYIAKLKNRTKLNREQIKAIDTLLPVYFSYLAKNIGITGNTIQVINQRTELLNTYYDFIANNNWDNLFPSTGKFRPTILEEFMFILFNDIHTNLQDSLGLLKIGSVKAYSNLYFVAANLETFISNPKIGINQKQQDFAIYRSVKIHLDGQESFDINIPVVAIENKTYLDKTMLDGAIATADKVKSGNPYSLFIVVTEAYDVSYEIDPAHSRIDQIYVLRKCRSNYINNCKIDASVVFDLFCLIDNHLKKNWSQIENDIKTKGKVI